MLDRQKEIYSRYPLKVCFDGGFASKDNLKRAKARKLEVIKRTLESGEDVLISRFGKFCVKTKHERRGRNPATGKNMVLEPRRVVTFKLPNFM